MTSVRFITLIVLLIFSECAKGQNLVFNPGFEELLYCPCGRDGGAVHGWFDIVMAYNTCSSCSNNKIPDNIDGQQLPFEGAGYSSVSTYAMHNIYGRSFLGGELMGPLQVGKNYYASFRAVSTNPYWDNPPDQPVGRPVSNKLGLAFSPDRLVLNKDYGQHGHPPATPGIWTEDVIVDTVEWKLIKGTFTATQEHQYIYIGNFFSKDSTMAVDPPANVNHIFIAWYYVDDIKLYKVPEPVVRRSEPCLSSDTLFFSTDTDENTDWAIDFGNGQVLIYTFTKSAYVLVPPGAEQVQVKCTTTLGDSIFSWTFPFVKPVHDPSSIQISGDYCQDSLYTLSAITDYPNILWEDSSTTVEMLTSAGGYHYFIASSGACNDSASVFIRLPDCHQEFYIPSAFTPDNDGYNDLFFPAVNASLSWKMDIYDRWGQKLQTLDNSTPNWNGDSPCKPSPAGIYSYVFNITYLDGSSSTHRGKVDLIR